MLDNSWMKCLKPGDTVAIYYGLGGRELKLGKINHITKTGRCVVDVKGGQITFNPDGMERGAYNTYYGDQMVEYTQEIAIKIHTTRVVAELYHTPWERIPLRKLDQIITILRDKGE
jgi:hypothetical protein